MSAKKDKKVKDNSKPTVGSGPGGRVELSDIHDKLEEIKGGVDQTTNQAKPILLYAGIGAAVLIILLAFVTGKKQGRRRSTWVEIRRQ